MLIQYLNNIVSKLIPSAQESKPCITLISLLLVINVVSGQINNTSYSVALTSTNMGSCGGVNNGFSTVGIRSKKASLNTFKISFDLPEGVTYELGSLVINSQTGSGDLVLTEFDISNLNTPIFQIERPSNANWQVGDFISFTFEKTAACDAVQYSYGGGLFKDAHTISYLDAGNLQTHTDADNTVNSYSLLKAYLSVEDIATQVAYVGQTYTRDIIIKNSGNGSINLFTHEVNVPVNLQTNYQLSFNGTVLTPSISGAVYTYEINLNNAPFLNNVGDSDTDFEEDESITLVEQIEMQSCVNHIATTHSPRWGCTAGAFCQIGAAIPGFVNFDQEWGEISLNTIANPKPRWDAPVTYTYEIVNDPWADTAYNVNINIGFTWDNSHSSPGYNALDGDEDTNRVLSNFNFVGGTTITPQRWPATTGGTGPGSFYIPHDFFTTDPDGAGGLDDLDGDGFFDDLLPGESTQISFNMTMVPDSPACNPNLASYVSSENLNIETWNVNTCGNYNQTDRKEINRHYLEREGLFNWGSPEMYDLDAQEGEVFNLSFRGNITARSDEAPLCGTIPMFSNDSSTKYIAVIDALPGITLDASADARYSQVGNQIIFTETNLADFVYNNYRLQIPINFPLNIDCSTYTGPANLELDYRTSYESSCYNIDLHCGTFTIKTHCNTSCVGPVTTSFEANRATAGWTDETMTTKVTLDPNIHATKYYMPKDEMVVTSSLVMNNYTSDNLIFEMNYVTDSGQSMADIISYTSGTITINDLSTGSPQTFPITNAPVITTQGTNDNFFRLDLSSYQSLISPTYEFGEGLEADEVSIELHFQFKDNFPAKIRLYEFYTFQGRFYSLDASNNEVSCETYNDRAYFFQDQVEFIYNTHDEIDGCIEKWVHINIEQSSAVYTDVFNDEFRPNVIWESASIEIPTGLVFNGLVSSLGYPSVMPEDEDPSSANNGLNYTVSGNVVTITPGPRFIQLDQGRSTGPAILISLTATSETPISSTFDLAANYQVYAYSNSPELITENETNTMNYIIPDYYISSDTSTEIGNSQVESFTVDVCSNNYEEINNNWIRVDRGSEYTITNAFLVDGTTETALNFTNTGNLTFIEFGTKEANPYTCKKIRFEGTYTGDATKEIKVSQNFDCIAYPSDFSNTTFFNETTLRLNPANAAIQLLILQQPTSSVTTCTDYAITLEARNAGEADLIAPIINFDIPGELSSLTINSITIEYPQNSGNTQSITPSITGNTVSIDLLDHSGIASNNGLFGSLNASTLADQIATVTLNLSPQCNYLSNSGTAYTMLGNNPSGTAATGSGSRISAEPIIITGAEPPYSTNTIVLGSPNFTDCAIETISVETQIVDGTTSSTDFSKIILPLGLLYVDGSLSSTGTQAVTFVSKDIVGGREEVTIALPSGADGSDTIAYTIDVQSTGALCEGSYNIDLSTYITVSGLSCSGVPCGTTEVSTGTASATAIVTKGNLTTSSYAATAEYIQIGTDTNYSLRIGLENTGTEDLATGMTYNVFCADASGVKTGTSIYTGTLSQAIPTGSSIEEPISFASTSFCGTNSNLVVEFTPSNSNCFCTPLSIVIGSTPSTNLSDLSVDKRLAAGSSNRPNVGDNITFEIEVTSDNTATNIAIEDIIPIGYTVDVASISNGGILTGNTINWNIASLNNTTIVLSYTVTVNAPTGATDEYKNVAQVTAVDQLDPDSTPNNDDGDQSEDDEDSVDDVSVARVDIAITKSVSPNFAAIGDTVIFTITAYNMGSSEVTNVQIVDELPDGYAFIAATTDWGTYDEPTGVWAISSLLAEQSVELTIEARVQAGNEYTNIAELISMDQLDQNTDNDRDEASIILVQNNCLKVYNEFSPNGDQSNEYFYIECIEDYPNNHLEIFNRWGNKVFETIGYKNDWDGTSQGRFTVNKTNKLPVGTYYYILDLRDNKTQPTSGWLYITR